MSDDPNDLQLRLRQFRSQPSTLQTGKQYAICVRNAYKHYGSKKDTCVVLSGLDMTVPKGVIYGLLGASGCGKTTLLNCIVGRKILDSGEVWVLGGPPRSEGSGVPGPRLGYMPQELALYGEFTMGETLRFFGWVMGMKSDRIKERVKFLQKLLLIPDGNKKVKELSVGQQRRVSLAAALVHEPELLILDEPTVGADPLLREIIWNHFEDITRGGNKTIVITTHYIDETRQAHLIGLMRGGYLLAEESPQELLAQMGLETLEEVFLKLSVMQNLACRGISAQETVNAIVGSSCIVKKSANLDNTELCTSCTISDFGDNVPAESCTEKQHYVACSSEDFLPEVIPQLENSFEYCMGLRKNNIKAVIWKNFLWMIRNVAILLSLLALPVVQITIFCICIGHDPLNLPVAVVNHEASDNTECHGLPTCNSTRLGCSYLGYLEERTLTLVYYDTEDNARESVLRGRTYASLVIQHNYSAALQNRITEPTLTSMWNADHSTIEVTKDDSVKTISSYLSKYFYGTFQNFIEDYLESCGFDKRSISVPMRFATPVYGENYPNFTDFVTPGIVLVISFTLGLALTAGSILIERNEGCLDRYLVNGITEIELLVAHFVCQSAILVLQLVLALICTFAIFDMTMKGSLTLVTLLLLCSGFCGMCFGFLVGCCFEEERTVQFVVVGSLFPLLCMCGILWPLEGMHPFLRSLTPYLPLTKNAESLRSLLQRGWDITMEPVYMGFVSSAVWTIIFLMLSIVLLKFKKR